MRNINTLLRWHADVVAVLSQTLWTCLFVQIWFMLNQKQQPKPEFVYWSSRKSNSQSGHAAMEGGCGRQRLSFSQLVIEICGFVCLLPWFLLLTVSWQSRLDAHRTGGNGATLPILHHHCADPVCLRCAVSIWPNLKQIGKMIVIYRGPGAALFSTITFRKPFRRKKRKKKSSGLFKRQFSLSFQPTQSVW